MYPIDSYKRHRQCQKFRDPSTRSSSCWSEDLALVSALADVPYQDCHLILNLVETYTPFPMSRCYGYVERSKGVARARAKPLFRCSSGTFLFRMIIRISFRSDLTRFCQREIVWTRQTLLRRAGARA